MQGQAVHISSPAGRLTLPLADLLRDDEQMTQVAAYGTRTAACATRGIPPPISHAHANNFGTDVSCQQSLQWRQE